MIKAVEERERNREILLERPFAHAPGAEPGIERPASSDIVLAFTGKERPESLVGALPEAQAPG